MAVFRTESASSGMVWNALWRSILENTLDPWSLCEKDLKDGNRYVSARVMELNFRKSDVGRIEPSGFGTRCSGELNSCIESGATLSMTPSFNI